MQKHLLVLKFDLILNLIFNKSFLLLRNLFTVLVSSHFVLLIFDAQISFRQISTSKPVFYFSVFSFFLYVFPSFSPLLLLLKIPPAFPPSYEPFRNPITSQIPKESYLLQIWPAQIIRIIGHHTISLRGSSSVLHCNSY